MNWGGIFLAPILWIFFSQVQQLPFFRVKLLLSGWRRCPAVPYRSSALPPRRSRWRDAAEAGPRGRRNRPQRSRSRRPWRAVHPGGTATARQGPGLQRSEEGETGSQRSARSQASSRPVSRISKCTTMATAKEPSTQAAGTDQSFLAFSLYWPAHSSRPAPGTPRPRNPPDLPGRAVRRAN